MERKDSPEKKYPLWKLILMIVVYVAAVTSGFVAYFMHQDAIAAAKSEPHYMVAEAEKQAKAIVGHKYILKHPENKNWGVLLYSPRLHDDWVRDDLRRDWHKEVPDGTLIVVRMRPDAEKFKRDFLAGKKGRFMNLFDLLIPIDLDQHNEG